MPDLSHLWQRFVLACAVVFGLAVGVAATVFGYSNTAPVDVGWSVFHLHGVPLWSVALVPLALLLAAGTTYHWLNNLHHLSEHVRHRHRVRELEDEVKTLRAHLDQLLEIPDQSGSSVPAGAPATEPAPAQTQVVASTNGGSALKRSRKRSGGDEAVREAEAIAVASEGEAQSDAAVETEPEG